MLTAEHVRARRRQGKLTLSRMDGRTRERAAEIASALLGRAEASVGRTRAELTAALDEVPVPVRDRKLGGGLRKMVEDRCDFESESPLDPVPLRERVFSRASAARREAPEAGRFDREAVLSQVAAELGEEVATVERALYADLRDAHLLRAFRTMGVDALIASYELAQAQAVLLKATRVTATVRCASTSAYRALFHKLKFRRLLYAIHPADGGGYRIEIDGPMSLFSSATKYGLALALVLPAIRACERWRLDADLRWGRERRPLAFSLSGEGAGGAAPSAPAPPDEVARLLARFEALGSGWAAAPAADLLDLRGAGLCVPDLRFVHRETGEVAWLEVMGFWSRQAVWRRVELVQAGLPYHVLFALSSRLRVSEAVLDDALPGALLVYKGAISARAVAERLDALVARTLPCPDSGA